MKVLGIDPGITICGFSIIEEEGVKGQGARVKDYGVIRNKSEISLSEQLNKLHLELTILIKKFQPDVLAVEKLFFGTNIKTALSVGHARGVILLSGAQNKLPVFEYSPMDVKIAMTGYGRASKEQIQIMVKTLLKLPEIPRPDDAADALAIALCHLNSNLTLTGR